jgi:hypothetical protein
MNSGSCDAVKNRLLFLLISRIRRVVLRRRMGKGILALSLPASVDRRCISDIEGNTRYELIRVGVLRDTLSMKRIMIRWVVLSPNSKSD